MTTTNKTPKKSGTKITSEQIAGGMYTRGNIERVKGNVRVLLFALYDLEPDSRKRVYGESQRTLAAKIGAQLITARMCLRKLESLGLIESDRPEGSMLYTYRVTEAGVAVVETLRAAVTR